MNSCLEIHENFEIGKYYLFLNTNNSKNYKGFWGFGEPIVGSL